VNSLFLCSLQDCRLHRSERQNGAGCPLVHEFLPRRQKVVGGQKALQPCAGRDVQVLVGRAGHHWPLQHPHGQGAGLRRAHPLVHQGPADIRLGANFPPPSE